MTSESFTSICKKTHFKPIAIRNDVDQLMRREVFCGEEGLHGFRGTSVSLSGPRTAGETLCVFIVPKDTASFRIHRHFSNRSKRLVIHASSHSFYCQIELVVSGVSCCFSHCIASLHFSKVNSEIYCILTFSKINSEICVSLTASSFMYFTMHIQI